MWRVGLLACALAALLSVGCVMNRTHQAVVAERDQLAAEKLELDEKVRLLQLSNEALDSERVKLMDETETLSEKRRELEANVARLRDTEKELSEQLSTTSSRLSAQEQEVARLRGTYDGLVADLEAEVSAGQIAIEQLREGIRVNVSDEVLFASGSAELGKHGVEVLGKVAGQLAPLEQRVEVRGHTDNVPIRGGLTSRFATNWELAAARATRVVRLLQEKGVAGERLTAVSLAQYEPVAENDTPENRARNRRIEIRLLPRTKDDVNAAEAAGGEGAAAKQ